MEARLVDTGKNLACHGFYEKLGFVARDGIYEADRARQMPELIKIEVDRSIELSDV